MGLGVGPVGVALGLEDGLLVGATEIDGKAVGNGDGKYDGDDVGERTGLLEGEPGMTGDAVGELEGVRVGVRVGAREGGNVVGRNVGGDVFIGGNVGLRDGLLEIGVEAMSSPPWKQMPVLSQMK